MDLKNSWKEDAKIFSDVNQTRCKRPEIEGWAGGLYIFLLPRAENCMCHKDGWFICISL
jgi:hypothetical protein